MTSTEIASPAYVLEEARLLDNLRTIDAVRRRAGVDIILALKAFALWRVFPQMRPYVSGATASSLNEARLITDHLDQPVHTYAVAYTEAEFDQIAALSSHLTFNSVGQYERFRARLPRGVSPGIRINPEYSTVETDLYNPAAPNSRLGVPIADFPDALPVGIEGLHFHTLCESSSHDLERTLRAVEERFGQFLPHLRWLNLGGGHLMTRADYDRDHLVKILVDFRQRHNLHLILEPGSAFAWQTGYLVSTVLDVHIANGVKTLILDVSFTAHMPDTLEMPYTPAVRGARVVGADESIAAGEYRYRLGGMSCLAGDSVGDYAFARELAVGEQLVLEDMLHYTTVKTTTFNGVPHPDLAIARPDGRVEVVRRFGYEDYESRLG